MMDPSKSSLCPRCEKLDLKREDFTGPPFEPEGKYHKVIASGTIGELRLHETRCAICRLLLYALSRELASRQDILGDWNRAWEAEWLQSTIEYDPATDEAQDQYGSALYPRIKGESSSNYGVQLIDEAETSSMLRARCVPAKVNVQRLKAWIDKCSSEHVNGCRPTYFTATEHPSRLYGFMVIDVKDRCLVQLPDGARYATLSYVWGERNFLTTVTSNLTIFQQPGVFTRVKLPKTIQDSLEVTLALGLRFIWVDALCIVQDDDKKKRNQIANMDAVFANSSLTLVAASGDHADAGLDGWSRETGPKRTAEELIAAGFRLGVCSFFDGELMNSPYAGRGWTYQEAALSVRCLVFLHGMVYFVCRGAVWREDVMAESEDIKPFDGANTLGKSRSEWPLRRYADHVHAYSSRQLTYPRDSLNAFIGIQNALSVSMKETKFWFGLPAAAFDWALLWGPPYGEKLIRRTGFPSWTWAGWYGTVIMANDSWSTFDQNWLRNRTFIEWYIVDEKRLLAPVWDMKGNGEEGEDVEEGEDLEQFMPSYENSVLDYQFGQKRCQGSVFGKPKTEFRRQVFDGNVSGLESGTLVFRAITVKLGTSSLFTLGNNITTGESISTAIQYGLKVCGMWWDSNGERAFIDHDQMYLLVLSFAGPSTVRLDTLQQAGLDKQYSPKRSKESTDGEDVLGVWHEWEYVNVMLVNRLPSEHWSQIPRFERYGIGIVHQDAIRDAINLTPGLSGIGSTGYIHPFENVALV